jgi:hypothetical protein
MALRDPVAVYNAANNVEAHLVRDALLASGIEAHVTEDVSQIGTWVGGLIPEMHKPQVWVERTDIDRAKPVLDEFERRSAELRDTGPEGIEDADPIEVVCDECGGRASFPAAQRGSVQVCSQCGAYLDVGDEEPPDGWGEGDTEGP